MLTTPTTPVESYIRFESPVAAFLSLRSAADLRPFGEDVLRQMTELARLNLGADK